MSKPVSRRQKNRLILQWSVAIFFISILIVGGYIALTSDGLRLRHLAVVVFASGVPAYWATLRLANFYEGPGHHQNRLGHVIVYMIYLVPLSWLLVELIIRDGGETGAIRALLLFCMAVGAIMLGFTILDRHRYLSQEGRKTG